MKKNRWLLIIFFLFKLANFVDCIRFELCVVVAIVLHNQMAPSKPFITHLFEYLSGEWVNGALFATRMFSSWLYESVSKEFRHKHVSLKKC